MFNAPYRKPRCLSDGIDYLAVAAAVLFGVALVYVALILGFNALARILTRLARWHGRLVLGPLREFLLLAWFWVAPAFRAVPRASLYWRRRPGPIAVTACLALAGWAAVSEMYTSRLEAALFSHLTKGVKFSPQPGLSQSIRYPQSAPYDARLGYSELPQFIGSMTARGYAVDHQAQWSATLARLVRYGAFPIYREKDRAGLRIYDRHGDGLYSAQFPERVYPDFSDIPQIAVDTLTFIEDRYLFDDRHPQRNPAIEWKRFSLAAAGRIGRLVVPHLREGGGSTAATQIEKFRHSPRGLTGGVGEKFRQMLTASARAYIDGPDTLRRREQIVTTYLNSTPLASMPGYGEVIGVPEALWVWFGTDYAAATKILNGSPRDASELAHKGRIYRQVLSLLISERRPSYYLVTNREALAALTDKYLRVLSEAGIIDPKLRNAALAAKLHFRDAAPPVSTVSFVRQKATEDVRNKLVALLKLPDLYSLDRLDLSAKTSIDTATQARVMAILQRLSERSFLQSAGMVGKQLLDGGDSSKLTWSFVLYERHEDRNYLRVHAGSLNNPFDINSSGKVMLGSTAKLRTLITYLDIIADLHDRLAALTARQLSRLVAEPPDPLTHWAASHLLKATDRGMQPMLDAAMRRTYSAAPASFFTGGGRQNFGNFEVWEDQSHPTVEDAFQHSINLAFVRLLRDVVEYESGASGMGGNQILGNPDSPQRAAYLQRFVETDSRHFLARFYKDYRLLADDQALELLARRTHLVPKQLAAVFLSVHPNARLAQLQSFLIAHLRGRTLSEQELWDLYRSYSPEPLNLVDRGYVAGLHPLELWLVRYLREHPDTSWRQVLDASEGVRQEIYSWLLNGSRRKQDQRIRIVLEQDAFKRILENWRPLGYPFAHLVPSLGTAIGASGDRPDALADLMGIVLNDGLRVPTVAIEQLHFATGTPYETNLSPAVEPERVMRPEVAQTVRRALMGVVTNGTASRLRGTFIAADGSPLAIGGKTGTGDNRFDTFAHGGGIISSRVVDRTATFVFFLGDRFFGTVTAYVSGPGAARFHFTSALAVQLLKVLEPELMPLIKPSNAQTTVAASWSR